MKWLFLCKENKPQSIRQKIMELYHGKPLKYQTKEQVLFNSIMAQAIDFEWIAEQLQNWAEEEEDPREASR